MPMMKILAAIVAVALVLCYLLPPVLKLKQLPLAAVILIGIVMMLVDLWQSMRARDDPDA